MKILQLVPNISAGGAERFTVDLSNELAKNHEVHLLTLYDKNESDLFREDLSDAIKTHSLSKKLGFDWRIIFRLQQSISNINPDIIHSHLRSFNYLISIIPFLKNIPIVHTVHSDAFEECSNIFIRKARKFCFNTFNITPVTISKAGNDSFKEAYDSISQSLIYNGRKLPERTENFTKVEEEIKNYKKGSNTQVFVHIGRLAEEKNQQMLVKSFNRLVYKDSANAILLIIGGCRNNSSSKEIQRKIKKAEEEHDHIQIIGEQPNATDYLHAADFFCLSSLYEGMPITLIEAFATGTIPICTPVGGIPEMVSELDSSLISESTNENAFYEAIKRAYFLNEEKKSRLKKHTKVLFEEMYSIEHCVEKYQNLYARSGRN